MAPRSARGKAVARGNLRAWPAAPRGNRRAVKAGAHSEALLGPLREQAERWALAQWPWIDDVRRHLVADLAARIERVTRWADTSDILILSSTRPVRVQPAVSECDRWQSRLWALICELDAEARERASMPGQTLAEVVAEIEEARAKGDEAMP